MTRRAALGAVLLAALSSWVASASGLALARQEAPFPHADHEGLFPVCTGCHGDVASSIRSDRFPEPGRCVGCHDGVDQDVVDWSSPGVSASNVAFDHQEHGAALVAAGDPPPSCEACHSDLSVGRMSVDAEEQLETCWRCHAHARPDHFGGAGPAVADASAASCEACHVPLASSDFDLDRLAALPEPPDHHDERFLPAGHGPAAETDVARCATCHTSDRCVACHVGVGLATIQAIPAAPETMPQPVWGHEYPVPVTHEAEIFQIAHRPRSGGAADCVTCHTRDDCLSCHVEPAPRPVRALPFRADTRAPGAYLHVEAPETHRSMFFMEAHPGLAASDPSTCASCHTETYCVQCHDGPSDGGYHDLGFVARHAADAYGQVTECATCHSTAAFCRECHVESGLGGAGRLGPGYHDAEPLWLLRHGGPARQTLETCASCHQQRDCVQCHGVLGAFRVSPHGDNFDAERAWARSPRTCIACHVSNPLGGA